MRLRFITRFLEDGVVEEIFDGVVLVEVVSGLDAGDDSFSKDIVGVFLEGFVEIRLVGIIPRLFLKTQNPFTWKGRLKGDVMIDKYATFHNGESAYFLSQGTTTLTPINVNTDFEFYA